MRDTWHRFKRVAETAEYSTYAFIFVFLAGVSFVAYPKIIDTYEIISLSVAPNAERAFEFGERHFDGAKPRWYDIGKAEMFFSRAQELDPNLLYVNHELARIEFLQSNYELALFYIDRQILLHGTSAPNAYYVRGLIEGYRGEYAASAKDYQVYLSHDPTNWAATNDLAWVLLKSGRYKEALDAINSVLKYWPQNPWLLNSKATALYELGRYKEAKQAVLLASQNVMALKPEDWSKAYPGNDPLIAREGLDAFKSAVEKNIHIIDAALTKASSSVR